MQRGISNEVPLGERIWAEINATALLHNADFVLQRCPGSSLLPVVKANAYGHGAACVINDLKGRAEIFAVANLDEAHEMRCAGSNAKFLLLSPCLAGERETVVREGLLPTVSSFAEAEEYARFGSSESPAAIHFKIDTGMGRLGAWREDGLQDLEKLATNLAVRVEMISTHLSAADEDEEFTLEQLNWFRGASVALKALHPSARFHVLNSAGILHFSEHAHDLVRPGLMLYGVSPVPEFQKELRPVMSWRARILLLKDVPAGRRVSYGGEYVTKGNEKLAVIAAGYADGYFRQIKSETACVLLHGVRCPVVGRVTMDQILADVTAVPDVAEGDAVTLLGSEGNAAITATEIAEWAGTIPWHVFTSLGTRVRRVRVQD